MSEKSDKDKTLNEINDKLDVVIALLATQGKDQDTQIKILTSLGMSVREIGRLLGISKSSVSRVGKEKKKKKKS